jgi:hypothetical protein
LILWVRKKSGADREYARPHIGASITGSNSGNGVLPTREPKQVENKNNAANDRAKRNQLMQSVAQSFVAAHMMPRFAFTMKLAT